MTETNVHKYSKCQQTQLLKSYILHLVVGILQQIQSEPSGAEIASQVSVTTLLVPNDKHFYNWRTSRFFLVFTVTQTTAFPEGHNRSRIWAIWPFWTIFVLTCFAISGSSRIAVKNSRMWGENWTFCPFLLRGFFFRP